MVSFRASQPAVSFRASQFVVSFRASQPAISFRASQFVVSFRASQPAVLSRASQFVVLFRASQPVVLFRASLGALALQVLQQLWWLYSLSPLPLLAVAFAAQMIFPAGLLHTL